MIMRISCLSFLLSFFVSFISIAQTTYEGTIISKQSKAPIPYITVKLIKEGVAASADEKGGFKLTSTQNLDNDTLQFTGVGYLTVKRAAKSYQKQTIEMSEDVIYLNEISISKKKKRVERERLHNFSFSDFGLTETRFSYYRQVAKRFDCKKEYALIEKIKIGRVVDAGNRNTYAKFRLHLYEVDPITGAPTKDLTHELIEVEDKNHTTIEVDLTKYNILIPQKTFFIAVEWLYIPYNERYMHVVISKFDMNPGHVKSRAEYITLYQPLIYHVPFKHNIKKPYTWVMSMDGRWHNFYHSDLTRPVGEAAISAQVIY